MEWDRLLTYLCSFLLAWLGGTWLYLKSTKTGRRKFSEAWVAGGWAGLTGLGCSLFLCYFFCRDAESSAMVVGVLLLSALSGLGPISALRFARSILLRSFPDDSSGPGTPSIRPEED